MRTVTEAAAIKRINRALAHENEKLRRARDEQVILNFGYLYVEDYARHIIIATHCDVERLGRELGVLRDDEVVADDQGGAA